MQVLLSQGWIYGCAQAHRGWHVAHPSISCSVCALVTLLMRDYLLYYDFFYVF